MSHALVKIVRCGASEEVIADHVPAQYAETILVAVTKRFAPNANLWLRVDELVENLSTRSISCLDLADVTYVGDLAQKTESMLMRTKNFGRVSLKEIKALLASMGLRLGMKLDPCWRDQKPEPGLHFKILPSGPEK